MVLNTSYFCDDIKLDLVIRNNINGDFSIVKKSKLNQEHLLILTGMEKAYASISLEKNYLSFRDKKWDWRYQINQDGLVIEKNLFIRIGTLGSN